MCGVQFSIIEFDPETFRILLDYLHTGSCPLTCSNIPGLICAAEHYDLPELLQACFHHAKQFLRIEVVSPAGTWLLAHLPAEINDVFLGDQPCNYRFKIQHFGNCLYLCIWEDFIAFSCCECFKSYLAKIKLLSKPQQCLNEDAAKWLEIYSIWRSGFLILCKLNF
jgi:hypothetical protein